MTNSSRIRLKQALSELGAAAGVSFAHQDVRWRAGRVALQSRFRAAEGAAAALAAGACVANDIAMSRGQQHGAVSVSTRHAEASLTSFAYLRFADAERAPALRVPPEQRTAAAGFFQTADDRWVYLHSGFPHNTAGMLRLLGTEDDRAGVTAAVRAKSAPQLENEIAAAGLCGAMVRSPAEWDGSVAGEVLNTRPGVDVVQIGDSAPEPFPANGERPLEGINVLDLTRILAGPTCARTLASYGAQALRIGAEHLPSIPLFVADTGFGKRAAFLNLTDAHDRQRLMSLLRKADVFSQGYRTGAMERHGLGPIDVAAARPGIVYVSINCYGHEGPWRVRPGWEQLAQTVTGMAAVHGDDVADGAPTLLPAAVNDYTTGYLAAFGALTALQRRAEHGGSYWVRVSLARTGVWVRGLGLHKAPEASPPSTTEIARMSAEIDTAWSRCHYLRPAVAIEGQHVGWQQPPVPLGSCPAELH